MLYWTFITGHGAVLAYIAKHRKVKALDIALELSMSERSIRRIIADLAAEGYINKKREGKVNRYEINPDLPLRRPQSRDTKVRDLLSIFISKI
jgi:DeoR/GlpR family transcriptional regulator of sugar metabolism